MCRRLVTLSDSVTVENSPGASLTLFRSVEAVGLNHGAAALRSISAFLAYHVAYGPPDPLCGRLDFAVAYMGVTHGHTRIGVAEHAGDDWQGTPLIAAWLATVWRRS